jgi:histidinol-phosphate aminotransferase
MSLDDSGFRRLVRHHYRDLVPYAPIVPTDILSEEGGVEAEGIIKLDGNENPYGPSPRTVAALASYRGWHIYPDPTQRRLRLKLGEYVGVGAERIIPGNGSDEIIDLLMRVFLNPGDPIINCPPTFGMYPFSAQVNAADVVTVPRRQDFTLDLEATVKAARHPRAKLIFLASPNNPTGTPLSKRELDALLETGIIVVVDEAYIEFAQEPSFATLVPRRQNLVVLRTFSKWAGLAGLRVGYGVMAPALAGLIDQMKPPYNVNVAGLVAAEAALGDREYQLERVARMVQERERMYPLLRSTGYLDPIPSQANFVLCRMTGRDAVGVKQALERRGIFIKAVADPALGPGGAVRISVGKPEHTDALLAALKEL